MIDFSTVKNIVIPEGEVATISRKGEILWQKQTAKKYKYELEYLESTGTQWINTGMYAPANTDIEVRFRLNDTAQGAVNNGAIFGGRNGSTVQTCTLFYLASTNPQYFRFDRTGQQQIGAATEISINANSVYEFSYKNNVIKMMNLTTGEEVSKTIGSPSSFTTNQLTLFAVSGGTGLKGKIYEWKYWENGVLLQHFIPVLDFNNVACMYDKVTDELFYNNGTGDFTHGDIVDYTLPNEYQEVAYLESTGAQYIDSGIVGGDGITTNISVYRTATSSNECFCGAYDGSHRLWLAYTFGGNWYRGYNNAAGAMVASTPIEEWVTIKISTNNDAVTYNINDVDYSANYTKGFSAVNNVFLFAMGTNNGANYWGRCRMAYCNLYDNNAIVRAFIPCYRKSDGKPGMYDLITETFFTNQGTSEFLYASKLLKPFRF